MAKKQFIPNTQESLIEVKERVAKALFLTESEQISYWDEVHTNVSLAHRRAITVNYYAKAELSDEALTMLTDAEELARKFSMAYEFARRDPKDDDISPTWVKFASEVDYTSSRTILMEQLKRIAERI